MTRDPIVTITHPELGSSQVRQSSVRAWVRRGWTGPDGSVAAPAAPAEPPPPPEPQFVMFYDELVPAEDVDDLSAEGDESEWTEPGASEVDEAAGADADEELA